MSLTLYTTLGFTEAVIDSQGNLNRFYQIASILTDELDFKFIKKEDDFDTIHWNFFVGHNLLTLHYSIYNGVSIFPSKTTGAKQKENNAVVELANVVEGKLMNVDLHKKTA
ncbi:MAG TPA: hypothetical protein VM888_02520 [Chitinophagaceae bacterium]|jgi:hypothetical protein|nr:hypothetical protein [Chitinophagaceae bacterium]